MTEITLREVTKDNLRAVLRLSVTEDQRQFVAPNPVSLSQAYVSLDAWPRAIYADDQPVGFVMLSLEPEKPEYWVWRFMIGADHQRNGHGRGAMHAVVEHVRTLPGATELKLSFVPAANSPQPFYESLGFELTGEEEEGEKVMRLALG
ncbi:MAG: GNAT family N-acetyltransferase [bacterium]|nr:GNAT family N-acetyltransferase [bacterium]